MTARLIACFLIAAPLLGGCLSDRTFGEALDDSSAATEIKSRLFGAGGFSRFGEVDVAVVDRFVLLSGRVPTETDRKEAERIAWQVASIDEVANELHVDKWDLGRDMNDTWITEQVRLRLLADNDIKGTNFNIQVHNGVVYLLGLARSEEELRKAAEHASLVNGVQKVVSYVKMRERGSPPPDISVAAAPPSTQQGQPVPIDDTAGAIRIAPPASAPAPITGPSTQPTTRGQYTDPYAPGATPPPGSNNNLGLLQSSPVPPPRERP
ncbi:MAG TPA: BON domain-containing protein [Hyphomonadaceae bacterium]|nr:BON domain-containing protein [Hyphomonadaceae bacterium]HPI48173.1 BON domain-containing protein [Hyphomonadaceae bacterium]